MSVLDKVDCGGSSPLGNERLKIVGGFVAPLGAVSPGDGSYQKSYHIANLQGVGVPKVNPF